MELILILKILLIIGAIVAAYAVLRNLDIIKDYFNLRKRYFTSKVT